MKHFPVLSTLVGKFAFLLVISAGLSVVHAADHPGYDVDPQQSRGGIGPQNISVSRDH
jgi:hypothetical protein